MPSVGAGPFSIRINRPEPIKLEDGQRVIVSYWSWKKMGYTRKLITISKEGDVDVKIL